MYFGPATLVSALRHGMRAVIRNLRGEPFVDSVDKRRVAGAVADLRAVGQRVDMVHGLVEVKRHHRRATLGDERLPALVRYASEQDAHTDSDKYRRDARQG